MKKNENIIKDIEGFTLYLWGYVPKEFRIIEYRNGHPRPKIG